MIKSLIILIPGFLIVATISFGQTNPMAFGARAGAMGQATSGLTDFWSVQTNQAGLAEINNAAVGFGINDRFAIKELAIKYGAATIPTKFGVFAVNYGYSGFSLYNESRVGLALGKKLGERFSMGLQLDYFQNRISEGYGSNNAFSFQLGLRTRLNDQLVLEAHAFNPVQAEWSGGSGEKIPTAFTLGLAYKLSDQICFVLETEKNMDFKPLIRGGMEYRITEQVFTRLGYASVPARADANSLNISSEFTFGFGLQLKHILLDLSAGWHQILGWSPQISFVYQFNSREKATH